MTDGSSIVEEIRGELKQAAQGASRGRRNPFIRLADRVVRPFYFSMGDLRKLTERCRFALVSMPNLFDKGNSHASLYERMIVEGAEGVDRTAVRRSIASIKPKSVKFLQRQYLEALDYALKELEADVVCFNELALPTHNRIPIKGFNKKLGRRAAEHSALVIAGSLHDGRTFLNTGYAFYPGSGDDGLTFHKHVSAIAVDERISIPPERRVACTRICGLNLAILICLALADFSVVSAVVRASDKIDLLIVCCYTQWMDDLVRIAQSASNAMAGAVVLVNYQMPSSECRFVLRGELQSLENATSLPLGAQVRLLEFDPDEFQAEKDEVVASRRSNGHWLFGHQNLPVHPR